jgi:hypothetical protein
MLRCLTDDDGIDLIYLNTYVSHGLRPELYEKLLPLHRLLYGKTRRCLVLRPIPAGGPGFRTLAETCGIPFYATARRPSGPCRTWPGTPLAGTSS